MQQNDLNISSMIHSHQPMQYYLQEDSNAEKSQIFLPDNQTDKVIHQIHPLIDQSQKHKQFVNEDPTFRQFDSQFRQIKSRNNANIKGQWTQDEDNLLMEWVSKVGEKNWGKCAVTIVGRTGKQCRERWFNNLNPNIKKGEWTQEEDHFIFEQFTKKGSSWSQIARALKGRSENAVKNRFYSAARKLVHQQQNLKKDDEEYIKQNKLYGLMIQHKYPLKKTLAMQNYGKIYKKVKNAKQQQVRARIRSNQSLEQEVNNHSPQLLPNEPMIVDLLIGIQEMEDLLKGLL